MKLRKLFEVQSTTKEMEDASRGYGMLLHVFDLRTDNMRVAYCNSIRRKVSLK